MYNNTCQEKSAAVWEKIKGELEQTLATTIDRERRKELRQAIRDFKSLIREKALLPKTKKPPIKGAGKTRKAA